jgi:hypothetical protein
MRLKLVPIHDQAHHPLLEEFNGIEKMVVKPIFKNFFCLRLVILYWDEVICQAL